MTVMSQMIEAGRLFDMVIVDPPSFASKQDQIDGALRAYGKLTELAVRLLNSGGMLVQASCSARVTSEQFIEAVGDAATPPLSVADAGLALAAAAAGIGRARVPAMLAAAWLEQGRITDFGLAEPCRRAYWLVAPLPQWRQKKVQALVAALTQG